MMLCIILHQWIVINSYYIYNDAGLHSEFHVNFLAFADISHILLLRYVELAMIYLVSYIRLFFLLEDTFYLGGNT
jgi:hypothetical protein